MNHGGVLKQQTHCANSSKLVILSNCVLIEHNLYYYSVTINGFNNIAQTRLWYFANSPSTVPYMDFR